MFHKSDFEKVLIEPQPLKRMPFKREEDQKLKELIKQHGENNWELISKLMQHRSVRQCKERWYNNLKANISKDKWNFQEDELLKQKYQEFGPKWKYFERFFPGRTSYNIKNRWSCLIRQWNIYSETLSKDHEKIIKKIQKNKRSFKKIDSIQNQQGVKYKESSEKVKHKELIDNNITRDIIEFDNTDDSFEFDDTIFDNNYFDCF